MRIVRTGLQVLGELLVTAAVVIALFIGWKFWWADAATASQQTAVAGATADARAAEPGATDAEESATGIPSPTTGETFAVVSIPRFGGF